jgi:hypothetical protein
MREHHEQLSDKCKATIAEVKRGGNSAQGKNPQLRANRRERWIAYVQQDLQTTGQAGDTLYLLTSPRCQSEGEARPPVFAWLAALLFVGRARRTSGQDYE